MVSNYVLAAIHPTLRFLCFLQRFVSSVCSIIQQCSIFNTLWKTHYTAYMIFIQAQSMTTIGQNIIHCDQSECHLSSGTLPNHQDALLLYTPVVPQETFYICSFILVDLFYLFCFAFMFCRQYQKRLRGELSAFLLLNCMHLSCPLGFGFPLSTVARIA